MDKCTDPNPELEDNYTGTLPAPPDFCSSCNNLVQNSGFERGLAGWVTNNVVASDSSPFEGTQVATMGPGVASMSQDILIDDSVPIFLSFYVEELTTTTGNLIVEVLWLNKERNAIGTGLRLFIPPSVRIPTRATYFDITDRPPVGTVWARLIFSKGAGTPPDDLIKIDQVIFARILSNNLVQNPSFELGLTGWNPTGFEPNFNESFTGLAQALNRVSGGSLYQDIPLTNIPVNSSFLLSFAARVLPTSRGSLTVQVLWLDGTGNQIGQPGLNLVILNPTLDSQANFLTYLDITQPSPVDAVTARIILTNPEPEVGLDQVIFATVTTPNLVLNPSFENNLTDWNSIDFTSIASNSAYEGSRIARGAVTGGVLFQDIPIECATGQCFLFSCGLSNRSANMLINVIWLDNNNREVGLGLSLVIPELIEKGNPFWLVYTGITEPAPSNTVKARIQFTKAAGNPGPFLDIDFVVFGSLI